MPDRLVPPRWRMKMALLLAAVGIALAIWALSIAQQAVRDNRATITDTAGQFCRAIPNSAARTAQALVDVLVADAQRRGVPPAQIAKTRALGAIYVHRARVLALSDLPSCPQEVP